MADLDLRTLVVAAQYRLAQQIPQVANMPVDIDTMSDDRRPGLTATNGRIIMNYRACADMSPEALMREVARLLLEPHVSRDDDTARYFDLLDSASAPLRECPGLSLGAPRPSPQRQ